MYKIAVLILIFVATCGFIKKTPKGIYKIEPNQEAAWKYQIRSIDLEMEKLCEQLNTYKMQAMSAQIDDMSMLLKEAERYDQEARKLEIRMQELQRKRESILQQPYG